MERVTKCSICGNNGASFSRPVPICSNCRLEAANLILREPDSMIRSLWKVTANFDRQRQKSQQRQTCAAPEVLSAVAWGLLEQGIVDDALLAAAEAVMLGESADMNRVGASALRVIFDERIACRDLTARLHDLLV